jgi:hypothetical protein
MIARRLNGRDRDAHSGRHEGCKSAVFSKLCAKISKEKLNETQPNDWLEKSAIGA